MHPDLAAFRHCPACAAPALALHGDKELRCADCGFRYFHNVAVAVAVVIAVDDAILMTRRAHAPAAGTFDFPGGFVDPGETLEAACVREIGEELGVSLPADDLRYLFSSTNRYPFAGTVYRTSDVYFGLRLAERPAVRCADDVAEAVWWRPADVPDDALSFDTVRAALARLRSGALDALAP
jgi:NADH pyrophosphatase NudC (nudix superfamily)